MRLRRLMARAVLSTPLPEALVRHRTRKHVTILAYHRILPLPDAAFPFDEELISATPEEFERELRFCQRQLDVMSLRELLAGLGDPARLGDDRRLPARPAIVTFDDGYQDNYEIALPILRGLGLTACFFLTTQIVGTSRIPWWDEVACCMKFARAGQVTSPFGAGDPPYSVDPPRRRESIRRFLRQLKRLPWATALRHLEALRDATGVDPADHAAAPLFMSWESARQMLEAGMELGGHTRTHPILSRVEDTEMLRDEIRGCYDDLRHRLGEAPVAFAYPVGSAEAMSASADEEIRRAGFRLSFSYIHSLARAGEETFRIPRLHAEYGQDYHAFRLGMALAPQHA